MLNGADSFGGREDSVADNTLWPIIDIVPYVPLLLASQLFLSRIASKLFRMIAYVAMNSLC